MWRVSPQGLLGCCIHTDYSSLINILLIFLKLQVKIYINLCYISYRDLEPLGGPPNLISLVLEPNLYLVMYPIFHSKVEF